MKVETFYTINNDKGNVFAGNYSAGELQLAKKKLGEMAKANPGEKFHLMKRICSAISSDITWEDSE